MPTDAATLVDLFNDTHGAKALYVPYTERTLAIRLSRLPHGYAWNQIRVGDRAALGTWPADWVVTHMVGDQEVIDRALNNVDIEWTPWDGLNSNTICYTSKN